VSSSDNTWDGVLAAARQAGAKFPELVAAQWALESGWGKYASGKHNYFGLKGAGSDVATQEFLNGKWVTIRAGFIDFPDLEACVQYLVTRWYKDWKKFQGVNRASTREEAAKELVAQGYATDPAYAEKLIKIMADRGPQEEKVVPEAELFRVEALQDTWLKKEAMQADALGGSKKVAVPRGRIYAVCAFTERAADAHALVQLAHGAGEWFVYEPHWRRVQTGSEAVQARINWEDFNCAVTPSLTVGEVLQWDSRRRPVAGSSVERRILETAREFQKVRDAWGAPLGVTSFYRPEPINHQVGGVKNSRHVSAKAVDVYPVGRTLESFYQWIRTRWAGGLGDGRRRGFIHLDTDGGGFVPGARPSAQWDY
jgi:uncharacterized protein YcbK (DUF882 family)